MAKLVRRLLDRAASAHEVPTPLPRRGDTRAPLSPEPAPGEAANQDEQDITSSRRPSADALAPHSPNP